MKGVMVTVLDNCPYCGAKSRTESYSWIYGHVETGKEKVVPPMGGRDLGVLRSKGTPVGEASRSFLLCDNCKGVWEQAGIRKINIDRKTYEDYKARWMKIAKLPDTTYGSFG